MATIKRTSPGPKIGTVGSGLGHPKSIGKTGNTRSSTESTKGGQYPFLPSPKVSNSAGKSGQVASGRENTYDFLPKKAGQKK